MDPRDRVFGPIATRDYDAGGDAVSVSVDFGDLVRKLVLSEEVVLESVLLAEFPLLIQKFGYDGVKALLESKRFRIHCDAVAVAQTGQGTVLESRARKGALPLGSYCFDLVKLADRKTYIHRNLQPINDAPGLRGKQAQKLRRLVADSIVSVPDDAGRRTGAQLDADLAGNAAILKTAVALAVRRYHDLHITPSQFDLRVERIDESDWRTETNLGQRLGLDEADAHQVVAHGLLGVGGLNQRIEYMETYQAMTGLRQDELPLMEEKLSFLARQLDPEVQSERFERVVDLTGLPDVDPNPEVHDVDMTRLLEIVADDEAREFRRWLRGVDRFDDAEVLAEMHKVRDLVAGAVRSGPGKTVRFLGTTGLGFVEPITGTILSALDSFLVEKVVPEPGPTAFLSRLYPSVFND